MTLHYGRSNTVKKGMMYIWDYETTNYLGTYTVLSLHSQLLERI